MASAVLSQSATRATISVALPAATLRALDRQDDGDALQIEIPGTIPDYDEDGVVLPTITRLIAVPSGCRAVARVRDVRMTRFSASPVVPRDRMQRIPRFVEALPLVEVGDVGWMRWLRVAPVVIRPARYDAASHSVEAAVRLDIDFDFIPDGSLSSDNPDPGRFWSQDFEDFFRGMLLNPPGLPFIMPGGRVVQRGSYLIITDAALANSTPSFAEWKRSKGFDVVVAAIYRNGISAEEIRDYIQDAYDNWARPPEYVLLLGDVNEAGIQLPTFRIVHPGANEVDVTDLPYSLMAGDDYFPDLFVGRISCNSPNPTVARSALARIVSQERDCFSFPAAAFHRATIFAGNFGEGGRIVLSPVETSEWLAQRLRERGWDVQTFFWRSAGDNISSGPVIESINRGVNIVSYRGWGDARGTHYPQFYKTDLDLLNNGPLLPVMTFFVCNVGDYGNEFVNPCFGEYSISLGSQAYPAGALSFCGPSDLYTNTRFNNAMLAGYYYGLLYQNMRTLGQLVLRAKTEVWRSNPLLRGRGNYVEFYYSVYNILGDPEVNLFLDPPTRLTVQGPQPMAIGESHARFVVTTGGGAPVRGALVTLRKGQETNLSILTDADGVALAPVVLRTADTLRVTVIAHQAAPYYAGIPVAAAQRWVGLDSVIVRNNLGEDRLLTGSPVELTLRLRNFGREAAAGVTATLVSLLEEVEILISDAQFGDIPTSQAASARSPMRVQVAPRVLSRTAVPFELNIRDGAGNHYTALFRLEASSSALLLVGLEAENGSFEPSRAGGLTISMLNYGEKTIPGLNARLSSFDNSLVMEDDAAAFGDAVAGRTVNCAANPFRIRVREGAAIGRQIPLRVQFFDNEARFVDRAFFNIVVGRPGPRDPVGPDGYGYYAYDEGDADYALHPAYNWIELDPAHGGEGAALHALVDDSTFTIELPFRFRYYGADYSHLSICSNGWVSFERTEVWDFNNWPIPSPLGPRTMICPFWEDLVGPMGDRERGPVNILTRADGEQGRFIVEWSRAIARSGNDIENPETFELILYDPAERRTRTGDGEILFQYNEVLLVDRGTEQNYATVGIQDWDHRRGLELSYAAGYAAACDSLRAGRAILFTTNPPDNYLSAGEGGGAIPTLFRLGEPFPNPFNSRAAVALDITEAGDVVARIFDLNGRLMREVVNERMEAGRHQLEFDAGGLPSGLYLLRVEAGGHLAGRKLTLMK